MSDWREVRCLTRDAWKSDTMESGELSAMIISTTLMLVLSASVLDSGQHRAVLLPILHKQAVREAATICPRPCKLTFELLILKVVTESCVTWATSVPILVFLGLSVLDLGPMYATERQTVVRRASSLNVPTLGAEA